MQNNDTFRSEENQGLEARMKTDDLLDLIEIALQLAMRLGLARTASHLFMACDTLGPAETEALHWGERPNVGNTDSLIRNTPDG